MNEPLPKEHLTTPDSQPEDIAEARIRPEKLDDFIGQKQSRENLRIFVEAARGREESLDHVLLHGPPGLGKTTMAQIVAREMGGNFRATAGPILSKAGDLAAILTNLQPGDVLFIDEIHRLTPSVEEVLYPAMEDFTLDIIIGEGPAARTVRIDLPRFTLVGATTRLGLIANPLRDRFGIPLRLQFYEVPELMAVVERGASILKCTITEDGAEEIARRARGTPRIAIRLLRRVRDLVQVTGKGVINRSAADDALNRLEVDNQGLDSADRRYLRFIAEHYAGGPVGIETIAAGLSEQRDNLEDTIEPYLLQQGMLQRTTRGRCLSSAAWGHLGLTAPKKPQSEQELPLPLDDNDA